MGTMSRRERDPNQGGPALDYRQKAIVDACFVNAGNRRQTAISDAAAITDGDPAPDSG